MYCANGRFVPGEPSFFACCGHMAKLFLSSVLAGRVCTAPCDRFQSLHNRDASTPHGGNFDLFLKTQRAVGDGERAM